MQRKAYKTKRTLTIALAMLMLIGIIPAMTTPAAIAAADEAYLETDIKATQIANLNKYPENGTFQMSGLTYRRGIVNSSTQEGGAYDGTATYRIEGSGYTRLSGEFGRVSGSGGATLTITGDGKLLGGFIFSPGDLPEWIDVAIPAGVQNINIRLQNGTGGLFALADAHFATGGPTKPNTHPPETSDAAYLENDLKSTQFTNVNSHPANGSFTMNGITYFRGLVNNNELVGSNFDGTATYRIAGRGFTRLTGEFGRISGAGSATLTITAGDGKLLGGYELGATDNAKQVNVAIPAGVQDVSIRLQNGSSGLFALADIYFTGTGQTPPQTHPPADSEATYLESDIISAQRAYVDRYPANGSFRMGGATYFRGLVNNSTLSGNDFDGTATYRIEGRKFTRLVGKFGRISGSGNGILTITADNVTLGGFEVRSGDQPRQIDIAIPPNARIINIRLQNGNNGIFAFGDAYFTGGGSPPPAQVYTISPSASPAQGGFVIGGGIFQAGTTVTLTAAPNPGWVFNGWYEGGVRVGMTLEWSFSATANRTIEARFVRRGIDNPHTPWATDGLEKARDMDLIPDALIAANIDYRRPITRAEFAGIAVRAFEIFTKTTVVASPTDTFTDTVNTDALKAHSAGIMVGTADAQFLPNRILTREEAAEALTRVFKAATIPGWTYETNADFPLHFVPPPPFADDARISPWTREGVYFMAANEVLQGIGNNYFAPNPTSSQDEATGYGVCSREHAIILAVNMIEKLG